VTQQLKGLNEELISRRRKSIKAAHNRLKKKKQ